MSIYLLNISVTLLTVLVAQVHFNLNAPHALITSNFFILVRELVSVIICRATMLIPSEIQLITALIPVQIDPRDSTTVIILQKHVS